MLEKPIAHNLESAKKISNCSAEYSTSVLVGHHRTHNQGIHKLKQILEMGTLGEIQTFVGMATFFKPIEYFKQGHVEIAERWRTYSDKFGS